MSNPWRPIASFSIVVILACALFFFAFAVAIAPRFTLLFADLGGNVPFVTRLVMKPITPIAALVFLGVGTAAGVLRPLERAIILSLTAGGGLALAFAAMITLYLPLFSLAGRVE